jgi:penicillin-binding protein-related factor A (putative recombinase)
MKGQDYPTIIKIETIINRKVKSFQNAWLENYGIRVTAQYPTTIEVLSAVCQF